MVQQSLSQQSEKAVCVHDLPLPPVQHIRQVHMICIALKHSEERFERSSHITQQLQAQRPLKDLENLPSTQRKDILRRNPEEGSLLRGTVMKADRG